jgi:excisionase family DNA binding protein
MSEPKYLSVEQAADELGVSKHYIYERTRKREIPVIELGNGSRPFQRIRREDFERWIESRTHSGHPPG